MRITERKLRMIIRRALLEQVVGYTAPKEKGDDDDGGYLDLGDEMGVDISQSSQEGTAASGQAVQSITKQRQQALDKGDLEGADTAAKELNTARKMRG